MYTQHMVHNSLRIVIDTARTVHVLISSVLDPHPDINDFVRQSGWFSYPGLAHGKVALQHVLASKCKLSHQQYMTCQRAVYRMTYRQDEKVNNYSIQIISFEQIPNLCTVYSGISIKWTPLGNSLLGVIERLFFFGRFRLPAMYAL